MTKTTGIFVNPAAAACCYLLLLLLLSSGLTAFSRVRCLRILSFIFIRTNTGIRCRRLSVCTPSRREEKQVEIDSDYCLIYDFAPVTLSSDVGLAFSLAPFPSTHFNLFFFFFFSFNFFNLSLSTMLI